jgi:D-arabinose 1-dehydrogenase-like Zn-dependent alcohol dehydrogenase
MGAGIIGSIVAAVLQAIVNAFLGARQQDAARQDAKQLGAAQASDETKAVIAEVADAQNQSNAHASDVAAIVKRMRSTTDPTFGGN